MDTACVLILFLALWIGWMIPLQFSKWFYAKADDLARSALVAFFPTVLIGMWAFVDSTRAEGLAGGTPILAPLPLAFGGTFGLVATLLTFYFRRRSQTTRTGEAIAQPDDPLKPASPVAGYWIGVGVTVVMSALISRLWGGPKGSGWASGLIVGLFLSFGVVLIQCVTFGLLLWWSKKRARPLAKRRLLAWMVAPSAIAFTLALGDAVLGNRPETLLRNILTDPLPASVSDVRVDALYRAGLFDRDYGISFDISDADLREVLEAQGYREVTQRPEVYERSTHSTRWTLTVEPSGRVSLVYDEDLRK